MQLNLAQIARWLGVDVPPHSAAVPISGISTDSRTIRPGELFVPLRGARFDGHHYLPLAVANGAAACLSAEPFKADIPVIVVADTLVALGDIASSWRHFFKLPVVAITGSCGKTTTKEMLAEILTGTGPGLKTAGNYNNLIGLPLTLLRLTARDQWAVVELGMNRRGEISRLTEIAAPDFGVITNIGPGHLEGLGDLEGVARAKGELFVRLLPGSVAVVNVDDERIVSLPVANGVEKISFGLSASATVRATELVADETGYRFLLQMGGRQWPVTLHVAGRHNVHNALAAAAVADQLHVSVEQIVAGLERFRPAAGRMVWTVCAPGWSLLEDYYNANPMSMSAALSTLAEAGGRRIAVLGDMLELGNESSFMHHEIGAYAAACVDQLVVLGAFAKDIVGGAMSAGLDASKIICVTDHREAFEQLCTLLQRGDRVLIKGSRGMQMEKIAELLRGYTPVEGA